MTRKEWKAAHRAARIARQKRDTPWPSFERSPREGRCDPLEGLETDLRRLMRSGAAHAAERMALPSIALSFPLRRVLAVIVLITAVIVGLTLSRGEPADVGVTAVSAPQAQGGLPAATPS